MDSGSFHWTPYFLSEDDMFGKLGLPELLIIGAILVLLFGGGRIANIGREAGQAIRAFREGLTADHDDGQS